MALATGRFRARSTEAYPPSSEPPFAAVAFCRCALPISCLNSKLPLPPSAPPASPSAHPFPCPSTLSLAELTSLRRDDIAGRNGSDVAREASASANCEAYKYYAITRNASCRRVAHRTWRIARAIIPFAPPDVSLADVSRLAGDAKEIASRA